MVIFEIRVVMIPSASKNIVLTLQKGLNFTLQFISMPCLQPEEEKEVWGGGGRGGGGQQNTQDGKHHYLLWWL